MSNSLYSNTVYTEQTQEPYGTTSMKTVVGTAQVGNQSYDIQGNVVDSKQDTPIDVNALQGAVVTEESLQAPSTGMVIQVDDGSNVQ